MSKCADFICVGLVSTCISNLRHKRELLSLQQNNNTIYSTYRPHVTPVPIPSYTRITATFTTFIYTTYIKNNNIW